MVKIYTDKRMVSSGKGIYLYKDKNNKYTVYIGNIKKSKPNSLKDATKVYNKILKERNKRIKKSIERFSKIKAKKNRSKKILKFVSKIF